MVGTGKRISLRGLATVQVEGYVSRYIPDTKEHRFGLKVTDGGRVGKKKQETMLIEVFM